MYLRGYDGFFGDSVTDRYSGVDTPLNISTSISVVDDGPSGLTIPGSLDGSVSLGSVYAITLTAGVTYAFAERPTETNGIEDAFLRLYTSGGSLITYDDDGGAGRSSLLTYTPTVTGTYLIAAGSWVNQFNGGGDVGNFTVDVWNSTSPDTPGTMAGAFEITVGTTFGMLTSNTDIDMYHINLTGGQYYTFAYSGGYDGAGETGNVARIELVNAAGTVVASGLAAESGMGFFAPTDGSYYVRVTPYTAAGTGRGGYTLDVAAVDPSTQDPLDAIRWESANNIHGVDTNGDGVEDTVYVYFAPAGENYGQTEPADATQPMATYGWEQYQINGVMNALQTNYTPITGFTYVQTTNESEATFRLVTTVNQTFGARFFPQDPSYGSQQGVGSFNLISGGFGSDPGSMLRGGFSYAVVLHEFGHAHGLAHPHDNGGGSSVMLGVSGSTGSYGVYNLNQGVYTVMSYNDGYPLDPDGVRAYSAATRGSGWSGSLSAFDIAALQERYGVHANNDGDTVYTLADDQASAMYQTIWDTSGNDTIAYSGNRDAQIDLLAATLDYTPTGGGVVSIAHGVFGGFTIANGVVIENATGGNGNDVLLGNSAANTLTGNNGNDSLMGREGNDLLIGGAGNDALDGGAGIDTASYAGAGSGVTVSLVAGTATGGAGSDTLVSIENVIGSGFADRIIGDSQANTIHSGNGIDVITLGGGNDIFVAEQGTKVTTKTGSWSYDIITDFSKNGHDVIDLSGLGSFNFRGSAANKNAGDLTYKTYDSLNGAEHALGIDLHSTVGNVSGPVTIVYGNSDGGSPDFAIILLNTNGVSASDFIFNSSATTSSVAIGEASSVAMSSVMPAAAEAFGTADFGLANGFHAHADGFLLA